jgi:hypothetical protein
VRKVEEHVGGMVGGGIGRLTIQTEVFTDRIALVIEGL